MARALELLLLDLLLDEEGGAGDGGGRAADGDDAVARARRERALLRDLDVGARHLLDLHQRAPAGAEYSSDDDLRDLHVLGVLALLGGRGALAERQQRRREPAAQRDGRHRRCGPKLHCNLRETLQRAAPRAA